MGRELRLKCKEGEVCKESINKITESNINQQKVRQEVKRQKSNYKIRIKQKKII
jgi:hypothetical protein